MTRTDVTMVTWLALRIGEAPIRGRVYEMLLVQYGTTIVSLNVQQPDENHETDIHENTVEQRTSQLSRAEPQVNCTSR